MTAATPSERIASANRHLAAAQAAAQEAVAASIHAFRWAAEAHERVARQHERAAAAGTGDNDEHKRLAAVHWAAAAEDRQRAKRGQLLLGDEETDDARGPDADQALTGLSTSQLGALQPQPRGGHFVAWEEPEAFATEVRAAFKPLR